jgi:hypothetical protein
VRLIFCRDDCRFHQTKQEMATLSEEVSAAAAARKHVEIVLTKVRVVVVRWAVVLAS